MEDTTNPNDDPTTEVTPPAAAAAAAAEEPAAEEPVGGGGVNNEGGGEDTKNNDHSRVDDDPMEPPAARNNAKGDWPVDPDSILSRLFDPDRKQKPALWQFIKLVAPGPADQPPPGHLKWRSKDAIAAYCLKCQKQFTYTRGTSKTVSRHMMAYHGLLTTDGEMGPMTTSCSGTKRGASGVGAKEPPLKKRKPGSSTSFGKSSIGRPSASLKLLEWMVRSFRPFSIVQDPGWRDFVGTLGSTSSSSSSSNNIPTTQEELIYLAGVQMEQVKKNIQSQLQDAKDYYSVSSELLTTDSKGKQRYCSVKVTFCTSGFERKSLTLAVVPTNDGSHFGAIRNVLGQYQLPMEKVSSVTRKGGDNKEALPEWLNKDKDRTCPLYDLDTLVVKALSKGVMIGELLKDLEQHVQTQFGYLKVGDTFARLPQETSTTTCKGLYLLLQKYKNPQTPVEAEATKLIPKWTPTLEQETMIQILTAMLKPFYDAVQALSGEKYPTIGLTIPIFRRIQDVLEKINVQEEVGSYGTNKVVGTLKEFQSTLLQSFSTTSGSIVGENPTLMWTVPLDPRLIHMRGLSDKEKESVVSMLIEKVQQCKKESTVEHHVEKEDAAKSEDKRVEQESTMGGIFWGDGEEDHNQKEDVMASYARTSVDRYLTTVKTHRRIEDPLQWWNANQSQFPELGILARIWFGASATYDREGLSNQLPDENLEIIAFLHDNADLLSTSAAQRPQSISV